MNNTMFQPGEYVTRDGKRARVYAADGRGAYPLHGAILTDTGWVVVAWTKEGQISVLAAGQRDLMPPKRVWWLNVYDNNEISSWRTKHDAERHAVCGRIARVRVEYSEGQFDD